MTYITLTQQKKAQNFYLYPNEDYDVDFTPVGETANYACVDDTYNSSDDDATYIYSKASSTVTDIYNIKIYLRPSGIGDYNELSSSGCTDKWNCVNEITADDDSSYIYHTTTYSYKRQSFSFNIVKRPELTIKSITVFARARHEGDPSNTGNLKVSLYNGSSYADSSYSWGITNSWSNHSYTWSSNPFTGKSWTWNDLDNLQIGVAVTTLADAIRITQIYGKINLELPDGSINYVAIEGRIKSSAYLNGNNTLKFYLNTESTTTYSSEILPFSAYYNYSAYWYTNPSTNNAWQWSEIENLKIGIEASTPSETDIYEEYYFFPDVDEYIFCISKYPNSSASYYTFIDELTPDSSDYIYAFQSDCDYATKKAYFYYSVATPSSSPSISKVIFETYSSGNITNYVVKINSTEYTYSGINSGATTIYLYKEEEYATNPSTGSSWTWDDLATLSHGVSCLETFRHAWQRMKVIVRDTDFPTIYLTQLYLKVNYNPEQSTCSLPAPETVERYNERTINTLNFWNGDREVYDLSRSRKGLVLRGKFWGSSATDTIECVRQMGLDGSDVTVSGFEHNFYNGTYKIKSFGWQKIFEKPLSFEWILELEDVS